MRILKAVGHGVLGFLRTLQLALPKIGVGWMFALLTIDFNRIAIFELGIAAVLITTMLSLHHILSPFQVIVGRIADRHPLFGFRRTPYLLASALVGSIVFMLLPSVVHAMGADQMWAYFAGFGLLITFGLSTATIGDSHNALIVEATNPRTRGGVISVVYIVTILSTIMAAVVMNIVRPVYTPEAMQQLYNLTPFIVLGSAIIGVIGMEKRLKGPALAASIAKANAATPPGNPLSVASGILRTNHQARNFFFVVFLAIFSIFQQDNILEVYGAEVFGMSVTETTDFQPTWGGAVLIGMVFMGLFSVVFPISKKRITLIGCVGTSSGMALMGFAAFTEQVSLVHPALMLMGFFTGFFNVGALAMMMEMTIEGAAGMFMGLWGMAQAFGNATAGITSGFLHTSLIESGLVSANVAYMGIFGLEALGMLITTVLVMSVSAEQFRSAHASKLNRQDLDRALEVGAVA